MAGSNRSKPGGYLSLATLTLQHVQAFTYDWRTRFGIALQDLFDGHQAVHEALFLTRTLLTDPGSHVYAAVAGWQHPMSREAFMIADLIDITVAAHTKSKHPHRYPRPTDRADNTRNNTRPSARPSIRHGGSDVDPQQVRRALQARGHEPPAPPRPPERQDEVADSHGK